MFPAVQIALPPPFIAPRHSVRFLKPSASLTCSDNTIRIEETAVAQSVDGTSNKVSNIIKRHIDNRELFLICILLLSHSLIFFRFVFYQYMVVFLFKTVIYVFLL